MADKTWQVTVQGALESLSLTYEGLSLTSGDRRQAYEWGALAALTFPTSYSAMLEVEGHVVALGFASTGEQTPLPCGIGSLPEPGD